MSPRPKNIRKVGESPLSSGFLPAGSGSGDSGQVILLVEEFEAVRLCDYSGLMQSEAAERMGVSRPTLTRIYASARKKIAKALVCHLPLSIEGGSSYMEAQWFRCGACGLVFNNIVPRPGASSAPDCPLCGSAAAETGLDLENVKINGNMNKIALPTRNGVIDDHFGHCEFYTILTVDDDRKIVKSEVIPSPQGCGCKSDIAYRLQNDGVTVMLAGNMGPGALNKLASCNISVIRGCSGPVMEVAQAYLEGRLEDSGVSCQHHHDGAEGHHCSHNG